MSEDFEGWGFEDHELICRLMFLARDFPEPDEPLISYHNFQNITEYRGWRAMYRLYGELTYRKGMALFHRWHESPTDNTRLNEDLFHEKLAAFYHRGEQPKPLPCLVEGLDRTELSGPGTPWPLKNFTNSGVFSAYAHAHKSRLRRLLAPARRGITKLRPWFKSKG
jgi:hypothetical protein